MGSEKIHKQSASHYIVKKGDTLSVIASKLFGDASLWHDIANENHLPNGNIIAIGLKLKIPSQVRNLTSNYTGNSSTQKKTGSIKNSRPIPYHYAPAGAHRQVPQQHIRSSSPKAVPVLFPAAKYSFDDLPAIEINDLNIEVKLQWTGDVTVQRKGVQTELELSKSKKLSGKLKYEYDSHVGKAAGSVKVRFDPKSPNKVEVACGFSFASKIGGKEFVSYDITVIPPNKFKCKIKAHKIKGEIGDLIFEGNIGCEIEIKVKSQDENKRRDASTDVAWVAVTGLVALGVAIIVTDIAKDVATLGVGAVESPLSFAAASALFSQAAAMAH